jgi:adenosylcobinamide kinase/adenosylcobinamide-phosphate guanylyltransferase
VSRLILTTGGCRSGKSAHAQALAESLPGPRAYLATCPVIDEEMRRRVDAHRRDREGLGWTTVEEPLDLAGAIRSAGSHPVILVDCLTLWVNNLAYEAELAGIDLTEIALAARAAELAHEARQHGGTVIFVTNEVGMGIVPNNRSARRFRDLAGRVNQTIAVACDEVLLLVSGIPISIKHKP